MCAYSCRMCARYSSARRRRPSSWTTSAIRSTSGLACPPVRNRGPEGDAARVARRSDVDAAVRKQRLAHAGVQVVELGIREAGRAEPEADDVELGLGQAFQVWLLVDPLGEPLGQVEMPLDHRPVPRSAVRAQRGPDRERARPPRRLGRRHLVARQVRSRQGEGRAQRRRVADEREPAVVRHVQPLVPVRDHRVGALDAGGEAGSSGVTRAKSPKAPSTCSHAP